MFKYINAEIYRLLCKKSFYILTGILFVAYALAVFVRTAGLSDYSMIQDAGQLFAILQLFMGGYLFASVYNDDITSKNLNTIVGSGFSKAKIAISKLIVVAVPVVIIFAIFPLFMFGLYEIFGIGSVAGALEIAFATAFMSLLIVLGYCAISAILIFGLGRPVFAMVAYVLLSIRLISTILNIAFTADFIRPITGSFPQHTLSGIGDRILEGLNSHGGFLLPMAEYIIFLAIIVTISIFVFSKKEMEF